MARYNPLGNKCDYCVRVHIRVAAKLSFDINRAIRNAQRLYGRYGIYFEIASSQSVLIPAEYAGDLEIVSTECIAGEESPEQKLLLDLFSASDMVGVTAIFVSMLSGATLGCASHAAYRAGVIVSSFAPIWTLAHEVGHVLLGQYYTPHHTSSDGNLMFAGTATQTRVNDPTLEVSQLNQMRRSPYLTRC